MCQSPRSFPCQPPCLHLRPPAGPSPRTPGLLRAPLQPLGPALPSCRGAETDTWPAPQGNAGALDPHPLLGHKPGHLGCDARAPSPHAPPPCRGRLCWCCPGVSSAVPAPFPPQLGRLLPLRSQAAVPPWCRASRAMACAPACLPPACRDPCGALTHLQHLSSFLLSPPTPGSSASVARSLPGGLPFSASPHCTALSPQQPPPVASGCPWWQETGACRAQAALLVPNPSPSTPGASAAPPGSLFALTTSVISRAGGSAGRLAPSSRFPLHPGQAGLGAAPKRAVKVPSAPAAPLWTNH